MMSNKKFPSFSRHINKFISRYPDLTYSRDVIYCKVCQAALVGWSAFNCRRHVESERHIKNREKQIPNWMFIYDLIFMLGACEIPQFILDKQQFRVFWKKYSSGWQLPTRQQVQRQFHHAKELIENDIKSAVRDKQVWLTVNVSTDARKNKIGNVLLRILEPSNKPSKLYLIASKRLETSSSQVIQQFVIKALHKFDIQKANVLMLVTDGTPYMHETGSSLKTMCPNLLHVTCLLHAFHLIAEEIRSSYPDVDKLITTTKMIFIKSAKRIKEFHQACPQIPEPPRPVLTKWGTWLYASFYYSKHFEEVKSVVEKFNPKSATCIKQSQQLFRNEQVKQDLFIIQKNYNILAESMEKLQASRLSLLESFDIVDRLDTALETLTDTTGIFIAETFKDILSKNPDFIKLRYIRQCIRDGEANNFKRYFAYANITSSDVEESFSKFTSVFKSKRTNLANNTIEGVLMMQVFTEDCKPTLKNPR